MKNNLKKIKCLCQSGKNFQHCCEPYLKGTSNANTPEQLMRSRFSAYAMRDIDYIQKTMTGPALAQFDYVEAKKRAELIRWIGLKIVSVSGKSQDDVGFVTFEASYEVNGRFETLIEKSEFIKENGVWYYYNGVLLT